MKSIWITLILCLVANLSEAQSTGSLQVTGEASKFQLFQKVKAVRCDTTQRGVCDDPVFFKLNESVNLAPGKYLVGYENSIYPELVSIVTGKNTQLFLQKLTIPSQIVGTKIRITRDLSSPVEQRKVMMSMFYMNRHFFRLGKENFGDLYLAGSWDRDFVQRFTYEACTKMTAFKTPSKGAQEVCDAWNAAKSPEGLSALFSFSSVGVMTENWVTAPGDVIPSTHPQYLVAVPMPMPSQDFVSVFAGVYKVSSEDAGGASVSIRVGLKN